MLQVCVRIHEWEARSRRYGREPRELAQNWGEEIRAPLPCEHLEPTKGDTNVCVHDTADTAASNQKILSS